MTTMKPKRVYVYFVEGKTGQRIVLSHNYRMIDPSWVSPPISDLLRNLSASMGLSCPSLTPIADFIPQGGR